ncbi:MAG: sensor domain-containing diguanylate cyclase [Thermovirgaceae bacterium]
MKSDVTSFPLYEMLTLSFVSEPEDFFRNMVDRFARVFGANRIALLIKKEGEDFFRTWGFRNVPDPDSLVKKQDEKTFFAPFDDGDLGFLYVEHARPLTREDRIFYSMTLPILEKSLELRRAHSRLKESEQWYKQIFQTAYEAIVETDKDLGLVEASKRFEEILGYSMKDLEGRTLFDIVCEEDYRKFVEEFRHRKEGKSSVYEVRFRHKNGHPVWVRVSASPIFDAEGRFQGSLGFFSDIDQRKKTELEISRQRVFFESLFRIVPEAIAVLDKDHCIMELNEAFTSLFGFTPEESLGKNLDDVLDVGKEGSADRDLTSKVLNGENIAQEALRYSKDGKPIHVFVKASPIHIGEEFVGGIVMYLDITKQKAYENYLKQESYMDSLTGLYNRTYFEKMMRKLQADPRAFPLVLMVMDMDNLKAINDSFGHTQGDEYLELAGYILKKCVRREDTLARIGGDEFAIILPQSGEETAKKLGKRIKRTVEKENERRDLQVPLSLSLGFAVAHNPQEDLEDIFDSADAAMYRQKQRKKAEPHVTDNA